jgi:hypothetical protein
MNTTNTEPKTELCEDCGLNPVMGKGWSICRDCANRRQDDAECAHDDWEAGEA